MFTNSTVLPKIANSEITDSASKLKDLESRYRCDCEFSKATLTWSAVSCKIPKMRKDIFGRYSPTGEYHPILHDLTGIVPPGRLVALMGASGAGKTTLLNILTCRTRALANLRVKGEVKVNGIELGVDIKRVCAYISQQEQFSGNLTVGEYLRYNAALRMGDSFTQSERDLRVKQIVEKMGLTNCVNNSIFGSWGAQSISGSERKLLSLASELLIDQPIIFCDEPTTGLDAKMATTVVSTLKKLAVDNQKAILCTIHQPSSDLFERFHDVILLAEGRLIFQGGIKESEKYFASTLSLPCPVNFNPADHYIYTLAVKPGTEVESRARINRAADIYRTDAKYQELIQHIKTINMKGNQINQVIPRFTYSARLWTQVKTIAWRQIIDQYRNPQMFLTSILQSFIMSLIILIVYFNQQYNQKGVTNMTSAMYMYVIQMVSLAITQIGTYASELIVFYRDYENGMYSPLGFFLGKNISDLPLFLSMLGTTIILFYWSSGLIRDVGHFLYAFIVYGLVYHLSLSMTVYVPCAIFDNITVALNLVAPIRALMSLLSGYWANDATFKLPFIPYLQRISYNWYGFRLLMMNQWKSVTNLSCDDSVTFCYRTGWDILKFYKFESTSLTIDLFVLFSLAVGFRIIGYFIILIKSRNKRPKS